MLSLDFLIATPARTGTHMLAFALDSHPDIQVLGAISDKHNYTEHWSNQGRVFGMTTNGERKEAPKKVITIKRNPYDAAFSIANSNNAQHFFHKGAVIPVRQEPSQELIDKAAHRLELMTNWLDSLDSEVLTLDYDAITQNKSISELPKEICSVLCEFLGVEEKTLVTKTHKPRYEEVGINNVSLHELGR